MTESYSKFQWKEDTQKQNEGKKKMYKILGEFNSPLIN